MKLNVIDGSEISEFVYDNTIEKQPFKTFELLNDTIRVNFDDIIATQFTGGNINKYFEELKKTLGLGIYSKAPCGGFVNFYKIKGTTDLEYVIYSGINEVSNSHYIVTIHQILSNDNVI